MVLQNGLRRQAGTGALVLPRLSERRIEAVQMVCTEIFQLDMTDSRIDALGQLLVADNRGVLRSALLLHGNYIFAVRLKLLAAVSGDARSAFLLKGRGESLGLFSCAPFRPRGRNLERSRPRLQLLPIRPPPAMDADGVGDQPPGLVAAFLDVSHCYPRFPSRWKRRSIKNSAKSPISCSSALYASAPHSAQTSLFSSTMAYETFSIPPSISSTVSR